MKQYWYPCIWLFERFFAQHTYMLHRVHVCKLSLIAGYYNMPGGGNENKFHTSTAATRPGAFGQCSPRKKKLGAWLIFALCLLPGMARSGGTLTDVCVCQCVALNACQNRLICTRGRDTLEIPAIESRI